MQPQQPQPPEPRAPEPEAPALSAPEPSLGFAGDDPAPAPVPATDEGLSLQGPSAAAVAAKDVACAGCLKLFKEDEISIVGDRALCRSCQESFQSKAQTPSTAGARPSYGTPAKKQRLDYAGFWVRTGAYIIDAVILLLIWHFALSPVLMKVATSMMSDTAVDMSIPQDPSLSPEEQMQAMMNQMASSMEQMSDKMVVWVWAVQVVGMLLMVGYFVILEGGPGQTIGKKALNLRVVTADGDRIGYLRAFARYIGRGIGFLILGIGLIMAAFDGEKRALHDRMCGTRVIRD